MKRTRKWAFVEQEAKRLAALGLSPLEIGKRLHVTKATVNRWMASGKLERNPSARLARSIGSGKSPGEWAASVRKDYALDSTDEQLVTMAESALAMALDPSLASPVRLNAMGRFDTLTRRLNLAVRAADALPAEPKPAKAEQPKAEAPQPPKRTGTDPRKLLMMPGVK